MIRNVLQLPLCTCGFIVVLKHKQLCFKSTFKSLQLLKFFQTTSLFLTRFSNPLNLWAKFVVSTKQSVPIECSSRKVKSIGDIIIFNELEPFLVKFMEVLK